jgi:universal stress protein E
MWNNEPRSRPLVIGLDFSQASMTAAKWATKWLLKGRDLILAHALVVPEVHGVLAARYPVAAPLLVNARVGALRRLEDASIALGVADAALEVKEGNPADAIAEVAREHGAGLIVVGKHGEGGPHRGYTGRTADRLVRSSPAPVLVANGILAGRPRKILVPLTYSSITPFIIESVRRVYDSSNADVIVIHVIGSAVLSHVLTMASVKTDHVPSADQIDEIFREDGERWAHELVAAGIPAEKIRSQVVFGEVSGAVLGAARENDADMIVMGSHAGPLRRLLLGSAATAILREADIPVLVVIEPEEAYITDDGPMSATSGIPASVI